MKLNIRFGRTAAAVVLGLGAVSSLSPARAATPEIRPGWAAWKATAPVTLRTTRKSSTQYVSTTLPARIDPGPGGDYADLRVIDDRGRETPYAIDPGSSNGEASTENLPLSDTGFVSGSYSQAVADAGDRGTLHDAVTIHTSRSTFFVPADIEASDDRSNWRDLGSRTTLYAIAEHGDEGNQTIVFPPTRSRWLRVRVYDPHESFPIDHVAVTQARRAPAPLVALPATMRSVPANGHDGTQHYLFDLRTQNVSVEAIQFSAASGYFSREVTLATSNDARQWVDAGSGTIERFAEGGAHTGFAFAESHGRYVRVTIENGNDAPLAGLRAVLLERPRQLVFASAPGRSYALAFANPEARAPLYDFGERLARESWTSTIAGTVGAVSIDTTAPPDTRSFIERNPWIVNAVFAIVGVLLALFAIQTIRTANAQNDPPTA